MQIKQALKLAIEKCTSSPTPQLDARILLCHVLSLTHEQLIIKYDDLLTASQIGVFFSLVERRAALEPIAYITGNQEFYGLSFTVDKNVLIPRPDTELLVQNVIDDYKTNYDGQKNDGQKIKILELGTGSGAICISIAKELSFADIIAVDISDKALHIAKINAASHEVISRINFIQSDWYDNVPKITFDYIISNPPYIAFNEQIHMSPSTILFEPSLALYALGGGLASYIDIIAQAKQFLKIKGKIFLEIGFDQGNKVGEILKDCGFNDIKIKQDIAGHDRLIMAKTI